MALRFTSLLTPEHRLELEELMFLHPLQGRFRETILNSIAAHGVPQVVEDGGRLRVRLGEQTQVQTLYALIEGASAPELAGVVVYTRNAVDELAILHIAVKEMFTAHGSRSDQQVTFALVEELCRVARCVRGVHGVRLAYSRGQSVLRTVHPLLFTPTRDDCPSFPNFIITPSKA